jgi:hypothetical protein
VCLLRSGGNKSWVSVLSAVAESVAPVAKQDSTSVALVVAISPSQVIWHKGKGSCFSLSLMANSLNLYIVARDNRW